MISLLVENRKVEYIYIYIKIEKLIARNFAKVIGRLGMIDPDNISKELGRFGEPWCLAMRNAPNDESKIEAYRGFMHMIYKNPNAMINNFPVFIEGFVIYNESPEDLK